MGSPASSYAFVQYSTNSGASSALTSDTMNCIASFGRLAFAAPLSRTMRSALRVDFSIASRPLMMWNVSGRIASSVRCHTWGTDRSFRTERAMLSLSGNVFVCTSIFPKISPSPLNSRTVAYTSVNCGWDSGSPSQNSTSVSYRMPDDRRSCISSRTMPTGMCS